MIRHRAPARTATPSRPSARPTTGPNPADGICPRSSPATTSRRSSRRDRPIAHPTRNPDRRGRLRPDPTRGGALMRALKTVAVALGITLGALIVIPLIVLAGLFVWLKLTEEADEESLELDEDGAGCSAR